MLMSSMFVIKSNQIHIFAIRTNRHEYCSYILFTYQFGVAKSSSDAAGQLHKPSYNIYRCMHINKYDTLGCYDEGG